MLIDGKKIATEVIEALARERSNLPPVLRLGVLMGAQDAASASFVKIKERVADKLQVVVVREIIDWKSTTASVLRSLERLSKNCTGVIVQLPLPEHIETKALLEMLPPEKDVDGITGAGNPLVLPPVVAAIEEIINRNLIPVAHQRVLVVGQGRLVGVPAAAWFKHQKAHVSVVTDSINLSRQAKGADIIVLGAGTAGILKPDMIKAGVVILDAGTSEDAGELVGDANPACAQVAAVFTPVPGGIGPIAVAMIFKNLFTLAKIK